MPTLDEAKPLASSASAKASAAPGPTSDEKPLWAPSMVSTSSRPWNSEAAMISIDMLTKPARLIAMVTSMRLKRSIRRRSSAVRSGIRLWVSAECR